MKLDEDIVLVDGVRTPFLKSGTAYKELMAYQLGGMAIHGLLKKSGLDVRHIDRVILGTTVHNIQTSNVAREAALEAGILSSTPCNTVALACISANRAICDGINAIKSGEASVVIAGGTDCVSDIPIVFRKEMRQKLFESRKFKSTSDWLRFIAGLRPADFKPEVPDITEFTTNRTMGQDCDMLAARIGVSRAEQDAFAVRSHQLAAEATKQGFFKNEVLDVQVPPNFENIGIDNGIRADSSIEKMGTLPPAFHKDFGTLTAANSSFLTDGAAVVLIMSAAKAKELGLKPKAKIKSFVFTGQDPNEELLLGPAWATPLVLKKAGLSLSDIDVFEYHEAFAGQILANLKCLADDNFCKNKLGLEGAVGEIPMDKLNLWGGSLSIGHPFGATGARILTTAVNRLHAENGQHALLAACAGGAHGHAMIIEKL
jgi:acetyl-CoA acetyltransferase family protein